MFESLLSDTTGGILRLALGVDKTSFPVDTRPPPGTLRALLLPGSIGVPGGFH